MRQHGDTTFGMRRAATLATAILAALLASAALASTGPEIFNITVSQLPSTCTPTRAYTVTDGASDTDCSTGSGSSNVICMCNDAGTGYDAVASSSGSISGSGTANTLAMWSSSSGLTDSSATQNAGTGAITIDPVATGANGAFDLIVGGTYGGLEIGNVGIYSSSFSASNLDLDKAILFRQQGNLGAGNSPGIEFAFMEKGNSVRFAIPESGAGNATAMIRSVTIAGPYSSSLGNAIVQCATWSDYDSNIDCDTGGSGADLFVQDDLEVQGTIFAHETINLEGATADGNQVILQVGADPGADVTLTLPTSTATIATSAEIDSDISTHASDADAHHGDDIIAEGDSNVEVIDAGTGAINFDVDGSKRGDWDANGLQIDTSTTGYSLDVQGTLDALVRLQSASGSAGITLTTSADTWNVSATGTDFDISDGIYFPFQIEATAPTNTLYLESTGEVGLGTNTPAYELHVEVAASGGNVNSAVECTDANCYAQFRAENDAQEWVWGTANSDNFYLSDITGGSTRVVQVEPGSAANTLYVDSAGEVGIGTAAPAFPLEVNGSGSTTINVHSTTSGGTSGMELGTGGSGNRNTIFDMVGDDTYTDYGFRIIRGSGASGTSRLDHRGTGTYQLRAVEAATIDFQTGSTSRFQINSAANVVKIIPQATAPATCAIGEMYVDTSGAYCACTATNTWSNMTATGTCV